MDVNEGTTSAPATPQQDYKADDPFSQMTKYGRHRCCTLKTSHVVHTNDTHSCIEPLSPLLADTAQADKGGYLRRAALLRDLRKKNPDLLLFDCGDFSQGLPTTACTTATWRWD